MLILENQTFIVKWCPSNIDWYKNKGYNCTKFGETFEVDLKDLPIKSHQKVKLLCDYCGKEIEKAYHTLHREKVYGKKDCCYACRVNKISETCEAKYGTSSPFSTEFIQEKAQKTFQDKYGVEYPLKSKDFQEKTFVSRIGNETIPISKPQKKLGALLLKTFGNCVMNKPCGRCALDCVIVVDGVQIDIEYDGVHWHQDKNKDRMRDEFVKSQGYRVFRIEASHKIPSEQQLREAIDYLVKGNHSFTKIKLDI